MSETATIVNLAKALLKSQQEIEGVSKDSTNPHFNSKFADLTAVIEAVVPTLNKNGIVVIQAPVPAPYEGHLALATTLIHAESGETLSGTAVVPLSKSDPQAYGSALTYARRYSLGSFVGLKFKDDDGEVAVGRGEDKKRAVPTKPAFKLKTPVPTDSVEAPKSPEVKGQPPVEAPTPLAKPAPAKPLLAKAAPPRGRTSLFPKLAAKAPIPPSAPEQGGACENYPD